MLHPEVSGRSPPIFCYLLRIHVSVRFVSVKMSRWSQVNTGNGVGNVATLADSRVFPDQNRNELKRVVIYGVAGQDASRRGCGLCPP